MPHTISLSMFILTIKNLGTDEQGRIYVSGAAAQTLYGCYAQTELGHGSNMAVSPAYVTLTYRV